jgi:hypothetical protein
MAVVQTEDDVALQGQLHALCVCVWGGGVGVLVLVCVGGVGVLVC